MAASSTLFTDSTNNPIPGATRAPILPPAAAKLPNAIAPSSIPKVVILRASLRLDMLPVNSPDTQISFPPSCT